MAFDFYQTRDYSLMDFSALRNQVLIKQSIIEAIILHCSAPFWFAQIAGTSIKGGGGRGGNCPPPIFWHAALLLAPPPHFWEAIDAPDMYCNLKFAQMNSVIFTSLFHRYCRENLWTPRKPLKHLQCTYFFSRCRGVSGFLKVWEGGKQ